MAMISLCLSILAAPQAADLDKVIAFECPPTRVENVVKAISNTSGIPFVASPQTNDDVLAIRVKGVTVKQLMAKIADVAAATWVQEKGGAIRLVRTARKEQELRQNDLARQAEIFRDRLNVYKSS